MGGALGLALGAGVTLGVAVSVAVVEAGTTSVMGMSGSTLRLLPMVSAREAVAGLFARALYRSPF